MNERRGYVVLIRHGDPEISAGIAEALLGGTREQGTGNREQGDAGDHMGSPLRDESRALPHEQVEVVEAEIDRQRIQRALLRVAVGNTKTAEDYAQMRTKARGDYAVTRRSGPLRGIAEALLKAYAIVVLAVSAAYRAQDIVLGRR